MFETRRKFLKSGALATLCAGIYFGSPKLAIGQQVFKKENKGKFETPYEAKLDKVFYYTKATFDPYLNTEFRVRAEKMVTRMMLVEIKDCRPKVKPGAKQPSGECFSLLFKAEGELSFVRTIHEIEHDGLKSFSLFLERVGKEDDKDGIYYEAVINHMTE